MGYSYGFNSLSTESGSLSDIQDIDTSGEAFNVNVLFDNQYNSLFKPYVDYTLLYHSDRKFNIFGTGLQFDFPIENSALSFYLSGGVGYGMSSWSHIPISGYLVNSAQSTSFVGTLKSGMAYQLTERFSLGLSLRYDFYDLDAKVVDNNYASENNVTNIAGREHTLSDN
ncbi:outer membrane protein [Shewanella surugensis]|uniref:Outer membrane protein beta-barrel domain-containing protein n=1 Tax=Shewanella surugensis TaxID=212020 RepID=A0ABT0LDN8_9GAMM|nr:hypothetical protein [Shewanella surugensis]MCL1125256.1 hypothetical protein [Shewanella surugensis]